MSWEAVGAIGEVAGAIAVIVTLLYLARQVRQSNVLAREDAQYHMLQNQISYYDRLATDLDFLQAMYGPDLSDGEVQRLQKQSGATSIFFKWHWEYLRFKEGIYGPTDVPVAGFRREFENANLGNEWSQQKGIFQPEFVEFMDTEIVPHVKSDA